MSVATSSRFTIKELQAVSYAIGEILAGEMDDDLWSEDMTDALRDAEIKLHRELARREETK